MSEHERAGLPRRTFLGVGVAAGAALIAGCGDGAVQDPVGSTDAGATDAADAELADAQTADAAVDASVDASADADVGPAPVAGITRGPWVQRIDGGRLRLRFESAADVALPIIVRVDDAPVEVATTRTTTDVAFDWPPPPLDIELADRSGTYTLHDGIIEAPPAGARVSWLVRDGETLHEGTLAAPPMPGATFRLGWIADTMSPISTDTALLLASQAPDLVIHGGDLQYMSSPVDTWNGFFVAMAPLMRLATFQTLVGNHEYEEQDEFNVHYLRMFGGQGDHPLVSDRHAFTWGATRFVLMNSEADFGVDGSPQHAWLVAELDAASLDASIDHIVVAFHRPLFSFSKDNPPRAARDLLHPLFRDAGVRLVLTGHVHAYERFAFEGVTYLVDGGGGALSYDPNEGLETITAEHPEELDLRVLAARTMGVTLVDVSPEGLAVTRVDVRGEITDAFALS